MSDDFSELFQDFDEATIGEFMDEFREAYGEIEGLLLAMEEQGEQRGLLDDVFRRVHSIKSNLRMVGFDAIAEFVHALEDVLDAIRHGQLGFDTRLSDVVLLCMDRARSMAEAAFRSDSLERFNTAAVEAVLVRLADPRGAAPGSVVQALQLLDPGRVGDDADPGPAPSTPPLETLFAALGALAEQRGPGWHGRVQRTLELARDINRQGGDPVDDVQLQAAVQIYVLACATGPCGVAHDNLLVDPGAVGSAHPASAARVLAPFAGWETASRILEQCEEAFDGSGYPGLVAGDALEPGAQILAIADRFETVSHDTRELYERPLLRAVSAVNSDSGRRFAPQWVERFNHVVRKRLVRR